MYCQRYVEPPPDTGLTVEIIETIDPAGHTCCIGPPPGVLDFSLDPPNISFTGPLPRDQWLPLRGTIDGNNMFNTESFGTVAGFPGIHTIFTGDLVDGMVDDGVLTIGIDGGLPTGNPLIYHLRLTPVQGNTTTLDTDKTVAEGETLTVEAGDTLVVPAGVTLKVNGTLKIDGTLIVQDGGELVNSGIVNNHGTVENSNAITNEKTGQFSNGQGGKLTNNAGSNFTNNGTVTNNTGAVIEGKGVYNNNAGAKTSNSGTMTFPTGTLNNSGRINNVFGGTLANASPTTVNNYGILANGSGCTVDNQAGGRFINHTGGLLDNSGSLVNNGIFVNDGTVKSNCDATVAGTVSGNQPIDVCNHQPTLIDAILALQAVSGKLVNPSSYQAGDINSDGRIGLAEALYVLRFVGELGN